MIWDFGIYYFLSVKNAKAQCFTTSAAVNPTVVSLTTGGLESTAEGSLDVEAPNCSMCVCVDEQQFIPFLARTEEKTWPNSPHLAFWRPGRDDEAESYAHPLPPWSFFSISQALSLWDGSL